MDDGMIFLADLSSDIGTQTKKVLGGFILATMYITALMKRPSFCLKNIQQVARKLESCRQTWYSFLGNDAQRVAEQ